MIRFAICNASDGVILRIGVCRDAVFNMQAMNGGEVAIEIGADDWPANPATHRFDIEAAPPVLIPLD